jgi:MFS-type transporter involved in bile tolerance (Atg22 family)
MMLAEGIAFVVGVAFELRARSWPPDSVYADGNYGLAALCYAIGLVLAAIATILLGVKVYTGGVRRSRSCLLVMLACIGMALIVFIRGLVDLYHTASDFG